MNPAKLIFGAIVGLAVLVVGLSTSYTVKEYERVVVTNFGKFEMIDGPGFHLRMPFVQSIDYYRTDIQQLSNDKSINTYTIDNQEVDSHFTIFYRLPPAKIEYVYRNVQDYKERLFRLTIDRYKAEMGHVNVSQVAEKRGEIRNRIKAVLAEDALAFGIEIVDFQIQNIDFTPSFREAINKMGVAKAQVEQATQDQARERTVAETAKIIAQGKANAAIAEAEGRAQAVILQGNAEAQAIQAKSKALADNAKLVELTQVERWNGVLPQYMLGGATPLLSLGGVK